jgi:aminoglycoside 6'-N-acetyltransferase I
MMRGVRIRRLETADIPEHARMRAALWPDEDAAELLNEIEDMRTDPDQVIFVAERADARLCGMVEARIRPYADPVDEQPCAFVEGWWVDADVRRTGVGGALIAAVENWARSRGFHELGSDALLDNQVSHAAHRALGFEERERIVTFRKLL